MRDRSRRYLQEWGMPGVLAALVVAFACGSSSIRAVKTQGLHVRWGVLAVALVVAAASAWSVWQAARRRPGSGLIRFGILTGSFLAMAMLSTAWSVAPKLTFERTVSLGLLFSVAGLVAYATEDDLRARSRALGGLAVGAVGVGLLGVLMLAFDHADAVQSATEVTPWRFRGFTENPNTISVLAAVALPVIGWRALASPRIRDRLLWLAGGVLLLGSTSAAQSRGGLIAGIAGLAVVCLSQVRPMRKLAVALVALAAILVGGIQLRFASDPGQAPFVSAVAPAPVVVRPGKGHGTGSHVPKDGQGGGAAGTSAPHVLPPVKPHSRVVPLPTPTYELPGEDGEIGNPLLSRSAVSLLGSGRVAEWKGVLKQAEQRPLLGYGFGTEARVFVDRWYYFQGGTAENSYLGLLLQLGVLGAVLFCGLGLVLAAAAVKTLRRRPVGARGEVAAELGVLVAAGALMMVQSYLYSVGNVASATAWIAMFMLGSSVLGRERDASRV
jgi:hypothetical protein